MTKTTEQRAIHWENRAATNDGQHQEIKRGLGKTLEKDGIDTSSFDNVIDRVAQDAKMADRNKEAFDKKIEFDVKIIPYQGKDDWIEKTIIEAHQALVKETIPKASSECDYCAYLQAANLLSQRFHSA